MSIDAIVIPSGITAGDSFSAQVSSSAFLPADGWSAQLVVLAGAFRATAGGTADGDVFKFGFAAPSTASWPAGQLNVIVVFSKAGERYSQEAGTFTVKPDPLTASNYDTRSTARRIVEAIDAWLSGKARWAGEREIGDRRIKDHPLPDLIMLRDRYAQDVRSEDAAANLLAGIGKSACVRVRM